MSLMDEEEEAALSASAQASRQSASKQSVPASDDGLAGPVVRGEGAHLPGHPVFMHRRIWRVECALAGCRWRGRKQKTENRNHPSMLHVSMHDQHCLCWHLSC